MSTAGRGPKNRIPDQSKGTAGKTLALHAARVARTPSGWSLRTEPGVNPKHHRDETHKQKAKTECIKPLMSTIPVTTYVQHQNQRSTHPQSQLRVGVPTISSICATPVTVNSNSKNKQQTVSVIQ